MRVKFILVILILLMGNITIAQTKWPTITNQTKPWTRWWWQGSAVNKKDLSFNLEQYKAAGLGGVELTPIYGVHGYENQFTPFLSEQWMEMFGHVLKESKRLGTGVDLANGTGWPFGGPWVKDSDASKTIYHKTYMLKEGQQLKEPIIFNQERLIRTANSKAVNADSLLEPVAANKNLQALALDQIQYATSLPLQLLVAYSDAGTVVDITNKVDANGKLNWTAGTGNWTIYALFEGLHGKMVERAAPGGEGYAIDHFSKTAADNYFQQFDKAFKGHDISYLRSFFNDSYEVDDAKGQANWTPNMLIEFRKRKGYALENYLPALFGDDNAEKNSRVIYDYRSVIDELLLEHFTKTWKKWASSKAKLVRNQSHGSPANTLDLYSAVGIPETEGTDILRFKFASSAANVTGKKLVSSESATWLNEHFLSSWGDVKKAVDLYFLGGVNHIFYHGTAYSPKDAPWPGWLFYAAVHFQPTNPQWQHFHTLNEYITRVQSFLQSGRPANDVLLYYPIIDRYSEPGKDLLQHFDGMEKNFEHTDFEHASKWMQEKGYSFDFFSDRQLQNFSISSAVNIASGGNNYQAILLPANKLIDERSFQKLSLLAKQGATILIYKNLPQDVPGLGRLESRRNEFQQLINRLHFTGEGAVKKASIGKGSFLVSDDLEALLLAGQVRNETLYEKGLVSIRRTTNDGSIYFINNRTANNLDDWIELNEQAGSVIVFDPMTGKSGLGKTRKNSNGKTVIRLQLHSFESVIIQTYHSKKIGNVFQYAEPSGETKEIKGEWTIEFLNGGPILPSKIVTNKLGPWTDFNGEDVTNFSGTAKYTISFKKPASNSNTWILDLGKVNETAEVILNGKTIATLIGPTFRCVIPASAFNPTNKLEIIVANLMANRIAYMDRNNIPWKIFYNTNMPARKKENEKNGLFNAAAWKPLPSGLSGPVTLTPANK
ncbi:MAG: glycosyl hydrolase [Ferruginibacter sp.]